jgi:5-methyltetrahydrofolate corrinoid/iron sulfur protein methyltransferase
MTTSVKDAMKDLDKKPIQDMVLLQLEGKPDAIDINLGPATKNGPELMQWMVKTVEEVTDLTLSLDTMNIEAMEAGLQVVDIRNPRKPLILLVISWRRRSDSNR